jgi:hypothetical protein
MQLKQRLTLYAMQSPLAPVDLAQKPFYTVFGRGNMEHLGDTLFPAHM